MNLKEMIAKARLIEAGAPMSDKPLVNLWMREIDGVSRRWIIDSGVHGPDIALSAAESSLKAGASEKAVLDALDECDRLYGLTDEEPAAHTSDGEPAIWFIFGVYPDGRVDVSDGDTDVLVGVTREEAEKAIAASKEAWSRWADRSANTPPPETDREPR